MTRPKKQTVDYFPHYCNHGKTLFIIEKQYGNDGYAFFYKLLELLGDSDGHVYDAGNPAAWMFLTSKTSVTDETADGILETLAIMGVIDTGLWAKRVIWMQSFVDSIAEAYHKRTAPVPEKPVSDTGYPEQGGFPAPEIPQEGVSDTGNPQTKLNESKLNKSKDKNNVSKAIGNPIFEGQAKTLADHLMIEIKTGNPETTIAKADPGKTAEAVDRWARDIELLIRLDKQDPDRIREVITWATHDAFWKANILSGKKLREKWDTLIAQMGRNGGKGNGAGTHGGAGTADWQKKNASYGDGQPYPVDLVVTE